MLDKIKKVEQEALAELNNAADLKAIEAVRLKYLSRKGLISGLMKELPALPKEEKPQAGSAVNKLKAEFTKSVNERITQVKKDKGKTGGGNFDITMPGIKPQFGHKHPLTQVMDDIRAIFMKMGFEVAEGPEAETEYYNFEALNIPKDHPSRDSFDTFFLKLPPDKKKTGKSEDKWLLRSQTSTVQIRLMETRKPPLKIIAPGRVFRPDAVDASHSFMFHQIEGLLVNEKVTFAELKGTLRVFARQMFGEHIKTRFRPHFFPFTEPSAEVDISCIICEGKGCRVCGHKGWLEVLGAGMVDPAVFEAVGYDAEKYTGFAFGMGIERIAMLKYGINDIRLFFENDLRFLKQF